MDSRSRSRADGAAAVRRAWDAVPEHERTIDRAVALIVAHGFTAGPTWTTSTGRRHVTTWESFGVGCYGHPCVTLSTDEAAR